MASGLARLRRLGAGIGGAWADLPLSRKGIAVLAIPLLALCAGVTITFVEDRIEEAAAERVRNTLEVHAELQAVLVGMVDAETSVRGYLLTGDEEHLEPYVRSQLLVPGTLDRVAALIEDNPEQMARLTQLRDLVAQRLAILENVRVAAEDSPTYPVLIAPEQVSAGKAMMDNIRRVLAEMMSEEDRLLADGLEAEADAKTVSWIAILGTLGIGLFGGLIASLLFTREIVGRVHTIERSAEALGRGDALPPVPAGNDELGRLGRSLEAAAALLREREQDLKQWEQIFANAAWGIVVSSRDGKRLERMNPAFAAMHGWTVEELTGQPNTVVFAPEALADLPEQLRIAHERGHYTFESVHIRRDGSTFPVQIDVTTVRDERGEFAYRIGNIRDITERKEFEAALAHERDLLHHLMDSSPDLIYFKDRQSRFTRANASIARALGLSSPDEVIGKSDFDLFPPEYAQRFYEVEQHLMETRQPISHHVEQHSVDGQPTRWVIDNKAPIFGLDGEVIGLVGISTDITALKQVEDALQQANRELESFSYSVSHDLRAPLRAIDGFSRLLLEDYHDLLPEEGRRYLRIVRDSTVQMGTLIDDLLAFSRLSRQPLRTQTVEMPRLVRGVVEELQREIDARRVEFVIGDLPPCEADPSLLRQVVVNLISNAIKFTRGRDPAVIEIGAEVDEVGRQVAYFVRDNGVGFDMAYAHKLFGVFQRLHRPSEYEGTGVGLAIVQRVVHRHGGEVRAEAELDRGATFWFALPAAQPRVTDGVGEVEVGAGVEWEGAT